MIKNLDNALAEMTTDNLIHEMTINCKEILDRQEQNDDLLKEIVSRGNEENLSKNHELFMFLYNNGRW